MRAAPQGPAPGARVVPEVLPRRRDRFLARLPHPIDPFLRPKAPQTLPPPESTADRSLTLFEADEPCWPLFLPDRSKAGLPGGGSPSG
jgi:hypothetical protein